MSRQRYVMLDIDGVLATPDTYAKASKGPRPVMNRDHAHMMFDPECMARLNRILAVSGAHVVVSSSWRILHGMRMRSILARGGMVGHVVDITPNTDGRRGSQIKEWMKSARDVRARDAVILDDDSDMEDLSHRLVLTKWASGLQDEHVKASLALFGLEEV